MENTIRRVKNIYSHLQDEKSKSIYNNRLSYMLTGDYKYIREIIASLPQRPELDKPMAFCRDHIDEVVFYGAGNDLEHLAYIYPDFRPRYICDKSVEKQQCGWRGIAVMSPEKLIAKKDEVYIAVCTSEFQKEIIRFLLENGFEQEKIINIFGALKDSLDAGQYFDADIMMPQSGEILVDGGCFDCGTDKGFIKWCSGNYRKIYAFEPDGKNYENCVKVCIKEGTENIELMNKGLWDSETELHFKETGKGISKVTEETSDAVISTVKIDDAVGEDRVSFIKLDIEGSELKALRGAERTIRRCRPKLAICIYHKPEDILEIPEYILSLHSDYKLFIRHYSLSTSETVLYAV